MNPENETSTPETESLRSEIDTTRQRMDSTIGAIGERLKGRHMVDEVLGFFRSDRVKDEMGKFKERFSGTAGNALHTVVDKVKSNPVPALLIGAGVGWLIYESTRRKTTSSSFDGDVDYRALGYGEQTEFYEGETAFPEDDVSGGGYGATGASYGENAPGYTPPAFSGAPGFSTSGGTSSGVSGGYGSGESGQGDTASKLKSKFEDVKGAVAGKASDLQRKMGETSSRVGERASQLRDRAQQVYTRGRERVTSTVEQHPIEVGFALLAAGLIAGLALPRSTQVDRLAGPTVDRLRQRARDASRDVVERGKHVVQAASTAAQDSARQEGLIPGGQSSGGQSGGTGGESQPVAPSGASGASGIGGSV